MRQIWSMMKNAVGMEYVEECGRHGVCRRMRRAWSMLRNASGMEYIEE